MRRRDPNSTSASTSVNDDNGDLSVDEADNQIPQRNESRVRKLFTSFKSTRFMTNVQSCINLILLIIFVFVFISCIFVFIGGFRYIDISRKWDMLSCRLFSLFGVILLLYLIVTLIVKICTSNNENHEYHLSTSLKIFLLIMTLGSTAGYLFKLPFIIVLWDFDFALQYHYTWENLIDFVYSVIMVVYMWLQLIYICFRFPRQGFPEKFHKMGFGITLIIHFCQKWLFESLEGKDHVCEQMNSTCHHFHTSEDNLTSTQKNAFLKMSMINPATYSFTMELLIAIVVVLCLTEPTNVNQAVTPYISANFVDNQKTRRRIYKIFKGFNYTLFFVIISLSVACIGVKLLTSFQSDEDNRHLYFLIFNSVKTLSTGLSLIVNFLLFSWYKRPSLDSYNPFKLLWNHIIRFWRHHEPDLVILNLAFLFYLIHGIPALIMKCFLFHKTVEFSVCNFWLWIIGHFCSMLAFLLDIKFLETLLSPTTAIERLSKKKFFCLMVAYQMIKNFIRATMYWIIFLDPEVPEKMNGKWDEWLALFNAFYPFTPLMNITSGLCWGHVLEELWNHGMSQWFTTCIGADYDQLQNEEEQPIIDANATPAVNSNVSSNVEERIFH